MNTKRVNKSGFYYGALLLIILIMPQFSGAQTVNKTDTNGLKQGQWTKTYSNGSTRYKGAFNHGEPSGKFTYYFPSGSIKSVIVYKQNGKVASAKTYQITGKLLAEGKYVNHKKDSLWTFYSDLDGKLVSKKNYDHGMLEGSSTIFFPDYGTPSQIIEYHKNLKNGTLRRYFTDGKPSTLQTYKNDTLNGPFKVWFPEGGLQFEGFYNNGYQDSLWTTYDMKGKIVKKENYSKGFPVKPKKK